MRSFRETTPSIMFWGVNEKIIPEKIKVLKDGGSGRRWWGNERKVYYQR